MQFSGYALFWLYSLVLVNLYFEGMFIIEGALSTTKWLVKIEFVVSYDVFCVQGTSHFGYHQSLIFQPGPALHGVHAF